MKVLSVFSCFSLYLAMQKETKRRGKSVCTASCKPSMGHSQGDFIHKTSHHLKKIGIGLIKNPLCCTCSMPLQYFCKLFLWCLFGWKKTRKRKRRRRRRRRRRNNNQYLVNIWSVYNYLSMGQICTNGLLNLVVFKTDHM